MTMHAENQFKHLFPADRLQLPRLNQSRTLLRDLLPTALERLQTPDRQHITELAAKIDGTQNNSEIIELAHRLTSREIGWIFPLLAHGHELEKPLGSQILNRIYLIIRERACPSLYTSGWLAFQMDHTQTEISKALTLVCKILEIRQQSGLDNSLAMISEIIAPDSHFFFRRLLRYLVDRDIPLQQFMEHYAVSSALPLGTQLISHTFLYGSVTLFAESQTLFRQVLEIADIDTQTKLVRHFFQLKNMDPATWNHYCQLIYRRFGPPDQGHQLWQQLKQRQTKKFQAWVIAATIGSHCRKQPDKARFYLKYAEYIENLDHWDEQTLLIHMPGFTIVDSLIEPDTALYYDQIQTEKRLIQQKNDQNAMHPASPFIPRRRVDDAIRRANCHGIIGLPLDPDGLRFSGIFIDLCLKKKLARSKPAKNKIR